VGGMGGDRRGEEGIGGGDDVKNIGECVDVYAERSTRDVGVIGHADGISRGCMSDGCAHPAEGEGATILGARERSGGAIEEVIRTGLLLCLEGLILVVLLLVLLLGLFVVDGVRAGCGERSAGLSRLGI